MNCKPGDLAIMTSVLKPEMAHNVGQIVEVVKAAEFDPYDGEYGHIWIVRVVGLGRVHDGYGHVQTKIRPEGRYPDSYLKPLPGIAVHDEQHDEQPTAA